MEPARCRICFEPSSKEVGWLLFFSSYRCFEHPFSRTRPRLLLAAGCYEYECRCLLLFASTAMLARTDSVPCRMVSS
jgi:hypothetical protein